MSDEYQELTYERERIETAWVQLRRVSAARAVAGALIAMFLYGHVQHAMEINGALRGVDLASLNGSVLGIVANDVIERDGRLDLADRSMRLLALAKVVTREHSARAALEKAGALTPKQLVAWALEQPAGMNLQLPYIGSFEVPLGYGVMGGIAVIGGLAINYYLLGRVRRVREWEDRWRKGCKSVRKRGNETLAGNEHLALAAGQEGKMVLANDASVLAMVSGLETGPGAAEPGELGLLGVGAGLATASSLMACVWCWEYTLFGRCLNQGVVDSIGYLGIHAAVALGALSVGAATCPLVLGAVERNPDLSLAWLRRLASSSVPISERRRDRNG